MLKHILFDLDGTVSDSGLGIMACVRYALESLGIRENDDKRLRAFVGPPLSDQFRAGYDLDEAQVKAALEKYRERYTVQGILENEMYAGMGELLRELKAAGRRLALATSKPLPFAREIIERYGVADCFEVIMGSELDGRRSTKIQVMEEALRQMGLTEPATLAETAMVGDRKYDIEGARHCGVLAIGVGFGYADPGELKAAGADIILPTVEALRSYLLGE